MKRMWWLEFSRVSCYVFLDAFYERTVRWYQPCFCYSCLFGCFSFLTSSSSRPHSYVHPCFMIHASCSHHPFLSIIRIWCPFHLVALLHVLHFVESWFFVLFAVERRSGYHYSFICWKGKFPPFSYLYPTNIPPAGSYANPSPITSKSLFFFKGYLFNLSVVNYITF